MKIPIPRNRAMALAILLFATLATNVSAQPICGDTIIADTTLSSDLLGCPVRGLRIGASNVTLDCNGHVIEADGSRIVEVNFGLNDVTVKNCVLTGTANTDGVRIQGNTTHITIIDNNITTSGSSGNGMRTLGTAQSVFSGNTITTTGVNSSAIRLQFSPDNVLASNSISTSGASARGVRLQSSSNNNTITGNIIHTTGVSGVGVLLRAGADGNFVLGNILRTDNTQPVRFESSSGNIFVDNSLQSSVGWLRSGRFPLQNGGISVHPDGRLFAVENNFGSESGVGTATALIQLDPVTGAAVNVTRLIMGGLDLSFGFDAMEITSTGQFLALEGGGTGNLYEIFPDTGEVAFLFFVPRFGGGINGLESNGFGILATTNAGDLVSINLVAMSSALIGSDGSGWTDLAVDPTSGMTYALSRHRNEISQTNHLYEIDVATGGILGEIGDLGRTFVSDMDFTSDGMLYGNDSTLLVIDLMTGDANSLGGFGEDPLEPPSLMNTLVQTTMVAADGSGSLHYPGAVAVPDGVFTDVSTSVLDISLNRVFVDSANFPFLDQLATNTLLGLPGQKRVLLVDDDDDGTFDDCPATQCALVSFAGGTLIFDVAGFTTYSSEACALNPGKGPGGNGPSGHDGNGPPGLCNAKGPHGEGPPGLTGNHPKGGPPGKNK